MSLVRSVGGAAGLAVRVSRALRRTLTHSSFPVTAGELSVHGTDGRIEVVRDRWGVPHVLASTAADAFFGHGFVHAQDRLFQMEGARRTAAGRLAEVAGHGSLESDRLMRRVGLNRAAERDAASLGEVEAMLLEAYERGVNAGADSLRTLPPEFALLGDRFERWRSLDTLLIGRLVLFSFAGNWNTELAREQLAATLGARRAAAIDPVHPRTSTVTGEEHPRAAEELLRMYERAIAGGLPLGLASNAWAVSGGRTVTGRPLLASDPHVDVSLPGQFHVAHLRGGDVDLIGAGVPGIPAVAIGHNAGVAWGITAGMADVADCYVEEFESPGSLRYRTDTGWAEASEIIERIEIAGGDPVEERVVVTRHGPVVSPALRGEHRTIALHSSVVEGGEIATPFIGLSRAASVVDAHRAVDRWPATTFNFVLADVFGHIAYRFAGEVPAREQGAGLLPQHGPRSAGPPPYVPVVALPRLDDPPDGIVASANNAPGGAHELGEEWCEPQRWERIRALLAGREVHDIASFCAIQNDRHSAWLQMLRDLLVERGCVPGDIVPMVREWDGHLDPGSAAAAFVHVAYRVLAFDLAERVAGSMARIALGAAVDGIPVNSAFAYRSQGMLINAAASASSPWFQDGDDRDRALRGAAGRAATLLRATCGDPSAWRLGAVQRIPFEHPLGGVPGLGRLWSRGEHPFGGDVNTVVQAQGAAWEPARETVRIAPGYRQVIDLSDWDRSVFMLPSGNSGIPGHPRYDDCVAEYLDGGYRPLVFTEPAIRAAMEAVLVLERDGRDEERRDDGAE